jgi:formaldehyde-activating enzyme involved in methanogenesis
MASDVPTLRQEAAAQPETLVVDLGKASKKKIKKLRRGEGELLEKVSRALTDMRAEGVIDASAQPVVVVVKEKKKRPKGLFGMG